MKAARLAITFCFAFLSLKGLAYTRQDTLRGSNGIGRSWWDVQRYELSASFDTARRSISGMNRMALRVIHPPHDSMQIDLQQGMALDSVTWRGTHLAFVRDSNVYWIKYPFSQWSTGSIRALELYYHGRPREAINPPWDGGFIWTKDSTGKPWIAVACRDWVPLYGGRARITREMSRIAGCL